MAHEKEGMEKSIPVKIVAVIAAVTAAIIGVTMYKNRH